jgi:hypothetical protein
MSQDLPNARRHWIYYTYFFTECRGILLCSLFGHLVCLDDLPIAPSFLTSLSGIYPIIRTPCPFRFIHLIDKLRPTL